MLIILFSLIFLFMNNFSSDELNHLKCPLKHNVNFDFSMNNFPVKYKSNLWNVFRSIYYRFYFKKVVPDLHPRIPKIIHQIWLGSPFPEEFYDNMFSWMYMHSDWEFKLWTDEDVQSFRLENQELFDASNNYGQRADILRYEIIYRYGGVYVDVDFKCLKALDFFHHAYDFYTGLIGLSDDYFAGNALIAATPGHPILRKALDLLRKTPPEDLIDICNSTGPGLFSRAIKDQICNCNKRNILLPMTFFYPGDDSNIRPESFAIHYSACSWTREEAKVK